jgi:hypothetical protein
MAFSVKQREPIAIYWPAIEISDSSVTTAHQNHADALSAE